MELFKLKNKNNAICFSKAELSKLFEITRKAEIVQEMTSQKISFDDLRKNFFRMKDIVRGALQRTRPDDRDEHEIFAALFIFYDFFERGSEICFEIKDGFDPKKKDISTLKDLNRLREGSISDFIIKSKDGIREFQLKRYRGILNTESIFSFIRDKISHYGNNLGDINLLILFQPQLLPVNNINFPDLSDKIKSLNFESRGEVLVAFNQENKKLCIVRLYPELTITRRPLVLPSGHRVL